MKAKRLLEIVSEAELSTQQAKKLHDRVLKKLQKARKSPDTEFKLDLVKNMDPKKLSKADIEDLKDFDKEFK